MSGGANRGAPATTFLALAVPRIPCPRQGIEPGLRKPISLYSRRCIKNRLTATRAAPAAPLSANPRISAGLPIYEGGRGAHPTGVGRTPEVFRRCSKGKAHNAPSQSFPLPPGGIATFSQIFPTTSAASRPRALSGGPGRWARGPVLRRTGQRRPASAYGRPGRRRRSTTPGYCPKPG